MSADVVGKKICGCQDLEIRRGKHGTGLRPSQWHLELIHQVYFVRLDNRNP